MRLLISGTTKNDNTISAFLTRHFPSSVEWQLITVADQYLAEIQKLHNRIFTKINPAWLVRKMDQILLDQVKTFNPTIVVIFKGMEISHESLEKIRRKGVKLVNYNFDHPFRFFSAGTGNRFVKDAIPYYDLHITYSEQIEKELVKNYNVSTAVLPFGFSLANEDFEIVKAEDRPEIKKACFVGNPDPGRITFIKRLLAAGISLDVFGFGWEKYFGSDERITIHAPRRPHSYWADPLEFWKVLRQYRVQLNFLRPHNEDSHNLRSFEIPAAGGIMLAPDTTEHRKFFEAEKEIFLYSDFESCVAKITMIMELSAESVQRIRMAARQRSIESDYSYKRRSQQLITILENISTANTNASILTK